MFYGAAQVEINSVSRDYDLVDVARLEGTRAAQRVPHLWFNWRDMNAAAVLPRAVKATRHYLRARAIASAVEDCACWRRSRCPCSVELAFIAAPLCKQRTAGAGADRRRNHRATRPGRARAGRTPSRGRAGGDIAGGGRCWKGDAGRDVAWMSGWFRLTKPFTLSPSDRLSPNGMYMPHSKSRAKTGSSAYLISANSYQIHSNQSRTPMPSPHQPPSTSAARRRGAFGQQGLHHACAVGVGAVLAHPAGLCEVFTAKQVRFGTRYHALATARCARRAGRIDSALLGINGSQLPGCAVQRSLTAMP